MLDAIIHGAELRVSAEVWEVFDFSIFNGHASAFLEVSHFIPRLTVLTT